MILKNEQLPGEAETVLREGEKKVKLVIASSHSIPKVGKLSLFQNAFPENENEEESVSEPPFRTMAEMQSEKQAQMMFDTDPKEERLVSEDMASDEADEGEEREVTFEIPMGEGEDAEAQLYRMLESLLDEKKAQQEEEPDRYVFRCDGVMSIRNGTIVIRYEEDDANGMGGTRSEIVLSEKKKNMVSIVRTGAVANTLVCEKGRRHISAYKTPVMPFQICVFAKECEQNVTFESGGTIFMNYYVELRGTEMQHTKMRITVKPE